MAKNWRRWNSFFVAFAVNCHVYIECIFYIPPPPSLKEDYLVRGFDLTRKSHEAIIDFRKKGLTESSSMRTQKDYRPEL